MNTRLLKIFILAIATCSSKATTAQELNCKVKIGHDKIQNTDQQVFTAMERAVTDFINSRKWTADEWAPTERVECNILINLTGKDATDPDVYTATLSIQASRPVYNSGYSTPTINYVDRDVVFRFSQYNQLQFDDNRVNNGDALASNLTAILAYYAYLTLALDYDSFSPSGGSALYKKAQNIVSNAPEQGNTIHGWKAFEEKRNRYWMVDQILSPRYENFRKYWYSMHREGLDIMYNKPAEGRAKLLAGIAILNQLQKDNPGSSLIQFFFNAKSDEVMRNVAQSPQAERALYIPQLVTMDVSNAGKYNDLK